MVSLSRKKLIQRYYSARAKDYDRQKSRTWKTSRGFGNEVTDELHSALKGFGGRLVLEVGVGSGRNALPLLEKIRPQLVGLDLSKEMLQAAKTKMTPFKQNSNLILGDADHLPFTNRAFEAIICMSTMHYFESQARMLQKFSKILKEKGVFVYGDLTIHEMDSHGFFEALERTLSKAHTKYFKPSEMKRLIETNGFRIVKTKTIAYRKSHQALMEDKGEYFDVKPEQLNEHVHAATPDVREQYGLTATELTLYYTVIVAVRED